MTSVGNWQLVLIGYDCGPLWRRSASAQPWAVGAISLCAVFCARGGEHGTVRPGKILRSRCAVSREL